MWGCSDKLAAAGRLGRYFARRAGLADLTSSWLLVHGLAWGLGFRVQRLGFGKTALNQNKERAAVSGNRRKVYVGFEVCG